MIGNIGRKATCHALIVLATCVSLSACAATSSVDAQTEKSAAQQSAAKTKTAGQELTQQYRAAGGGKDYEWGKDHIFVKLSKSETGGALTLIQDNLKPGFDLGLHLHRTHTEIFYILDGAVEFVIGETPFVAETGAVVYLPAGTAHAAKSSVGGKMLMFYTPGGFDEMLAEIEAASWLQRLNPFASARRDEKYDLHKLSEAPQSQSNGPQPVTLLPGKGERTSVESGARVVKLTEKQTDGLATLVEETLKPGVERASQTSDGQAEVIYVLNGSVQFKNADNTVQTATSGATIFFPTGKATPVRSADGATLLVFRMPR